MRGRVFESFVVVVFERGDNSGNSLYSSSSSSSSLSYYMIVNVRSILHPPPCSSLLSPPPPLLPCHEPSLLGTDSPWPFSSVADAKRAPRTTLTYRLTCTPDLCSTPLSVVGCNNENP